MRVALYARVSSEEQVAKYGLPLQVQAFEEYCGRHGLEAAAEAFRFVDEGYSGSTLERPEMDRLRDEVARFTIAGPNPFDAVVVYDEDRVARETSLYLLVAMELERRGVLVLTINEAPGTEASPERKLQQTMKAAMAEYAKSQFLERARRGRLSRARSGKYIGSRPPYGYRYQSSGVLEPEPDEAAVVGEIFETMGKRGGTIGSIATDLTRRGIRPPNAFRYDLASDQWGESTVARILNRTDYIGEAIYNRNRAVVPEHHREDRPYRRKTKTTTAKRPESDWVRIPVPPLVERDLWDAAHAQMDFNRAKHARNVKRFYLLRTMARCVCGSALAGNPSHDVRYYRCPSCRKSVKADALEALVWGQVASLLQRPDTVEAGLASRGREGGLRSKAAAARLDRATRSLAQNVAEEAKLLDAALVGIFSPAAIGAKVSAIRDARVRLEAEQSEAASDVMFQQETSVRLAAIADACRVIAGRLETLADDERHWLLQRLGIAVTWSSTGDVEVSGILPAVEDVSAPVGLGLPIGSRRSAETSVGRFAVALSV